MAYGQQPLLAAGASPAVLALPSLAGGGGRGGGGEELATESDPAGCGVGVRGGGGDGGGGGLIARREGTISAAAAAGRQASLCMCRLYCSSERNTTLQTVQRGLCRI